MRHQVHEYKTVNHDFGCKCKCLQNDVVVDPHVPANLNLCIADSTGASATTSVTVGSVNWKSTWWINLATMELIMIQLYYFLEHHISRSQVQGNAPSMDGFHLEQKMKLSGVAHYLC